MAGSVLLIDDDVDVLRSIGNYFERLGYEVTRELSGEAGLATFDRIRPEVVILDLRLPGMDGMEVLENLRQRDAAVILLTGEVDVPTAVRAMQLGAENFLTKPVDMEHLAAATARVADKARLRRVNEALLVQSSPDHGLDSLGTSTSPVRRMTAASRWRRFSSTSMPSIPGSRRSRITTSGRIRSKVARPASPLSSRVTS